MAKLPRQSPIFWLFALVLFLTVIVYGLRGWGLLGFLPGGIILGLIGLTVILGMVWLWQVNQG